MKLTFPQIYKKCMPYTMISEARLKNIFDSVNYVVDKKILGDVVECGVWKGGAVMCMCLSLLAKKNTTKKIYLFDTFSGMTRPEPHDVSYLGESAIELLSKKENYLVEARSSLEETKKNVLSTGYPQDKLHFICGPVEETLPCENPNKIALLRLDTDWYKSTYHELRHLFYKVEQGGIVIIDDYGHWKGAKKAVDEFLIAQNLNVDLREIDYTGRFFIKC